MCPRRRPGSDQPTGMFQHMPTSSISSLPGCIATTAGTSQVNRPSTWPATRAMRLLSIASGWQVQFEDDAIYARMVAALRDAVGESAAGDVVNGVHVIPLDDLPNEIEALIAELRSPPQVDRHELPTTGPLTLREIDVLRLLVDGHANRAIGETFRSANGRSKRTYSTFSPSWRWTRARRPPPSPCGTDSSDPDRRDRCVELRTLPWGPPATNAWLPRCARPTDPANCNLCRRLAHGRHVQTRMPSLAHARDRRAFARRQARTPGVPIRKRFRDRPDRRTHSHQCPLPRPDTPWRPSVHPGE